DSRPDSRGQSGADPAGNPRPGGHALPALAVGRRPPPPVHGAADRAGERLRPRERREPPRPARRREVGDPTDLSRATRQVTAGPELQHDPAAPAIVREPSTLAPDVVGDEVSDQGASVVLDHDPLLLPYRFVQARIFLC